jgi:hypothetical protein
MLLPEILSKNESFRNALLKAMPALNLAFQAADNAEAAEARLDDSNALANAQRYAGHLAIERYKTRVRSMTGISSVESEPLLDEHSGLDYLEQVAQQAEREAALKEETITVKPPTKKRK